MKRILSLLTTITLTASATTSVISCSSIISGGKAPSKESNIKDGNIKPSTLVASMNALEGLKLFLDKGEIQKQTININTVEVKDIYRHVMADNVKIKNNDQYTLASTPLKTTIKNYILKAANIPSNSKILEDLDIIVKKDSKIVLGQSLTFELKLLYTTKGIMSTSIIYYFDNGFRLIPSNNLNNFDVLKSKLNNKSFDLKGYADIDLNLFNLYDFKDKDSNTKRKTWDAIFQYISIRAIDQYGLAFDTVHSLKNIIMDSGNSGINKHDWHSGYNILNIKDNDKDFNVVVYGHYSIKAMGDYLNKDNIYEIWGKSDLILDKTVDNQLLSSSIVQNNIQQKLSSQSFTSKWNKDSKNPLLDDTDAKRITAFNTDSKYKSFESTKNNSQTININTIVVKKYFSKEDATINTNFDVHMLTTDNDLKVSLDNHTFAIPEKYNLTGLDSSKATNPFREWLTNQHDINYFDAKKLTLNSGQTLTYKNTNIIKVFIDGKSVWATVKINLQIDSNGYIKEIQDKTKRFDIFINGIFDQNVQAKSDPQDNPTKDYIEKIQAAIHKADPSIPDTVIKSIAVDQKAALADTYLKEGDNTIKLQLTYKGATVAFTLPVRFHSGKTSRQNWYASRDNGHPHNPNPYNSEYYFGVQFTHYETALIAKENWINKQVWNYLFKTTGPSSPMRDDMVKGLSHWWYRLGLHSRIDSLIGELFVAHTIYDNGGKQFTDNGYGYKNVTDVAKIAAASDYGTGGMTLVFYGHYYNWVGGSRFYTVGMLVKTTNPNDQDFSNTDTIGNIF